MSAFSSTADSASSRKDVPATAVVPVEKLDVAERTKLTSKAGRVSARASKTWKSRTSSKRH
jgi:hypothetical protein